MRIVLVLIAALVTAAPASAATVTYVPGVVADREQEPGTVEIREQGPEVNDMSISHAPRVLTVHDAVTPPQAGAGCEQVDERTVRCEGDIGHVDARLGALDDRATVGGTRLHYAVIGGGDGDDALTSATVATLEGDAGRDTLIGGDERDTLHGGSGDDRIDAGSGDDYLDGGPGDDVIRGEDGNDILYGGAGVDDEVGAGDDDLDGGPGNDTLSDEDRLSRVQDVGPDRLVGGTGVDLVYSYIDRDQDVVVDLSDDAGDGEPGENDVLVNVEGLYGGRGDDILTGDGDDNVLAGGLGEDVMRGRGGDDRIDHLGDDSATGDRGNDTVVSTAWSAGPLACGGGRDTVRLQTAPAYVLPQTPPPGPRLGRDCDRLTQGPITVDPFPVAVRGGRLTFRFHAFRCCRRVLRLTSPNPPYRRADRERITRSRETVSSRRVRRTHRLVIGAGDDPPLAWRVRP